jgi:membrane-bound lytic murein transglycosylase B
MLQAKRFCTLVLLLVLAAGAGAAEHPGSAGFIDRAVSEFGLNAAEVGALLAGATFQQSIVDAIKRPAESKPWYEYRPIFLTDDRIAEGVSFWKQHRELINRVSVQFGVDPQIIVSIIGVETLYGRITGSYRVLDALTTLGFYYPKELKRDRSEFFSRELLQFIVLSKEERLPVDRVTGSYAGAMGMGQFIPSSYREYAVDFDGNGSRDLWRSTPDVVGSVANYLHRHGWLAGEPVAVRAVLAGDADGALASGRDYKPRMSVSSIAARGYRSAVEVDPDRHAAVLKLETEGDWEHWLTFENFYVITRYNRSPMYAMAVLQLSEEIRSGMGGS